MTGVSIIGVGMTPFAKHHGRSLKNLVAAAVRAALADAQIDAAAVHAAFFANTVQGVHEGQLMVRGQMALRPLGFEGIPIYNVENACASASSALALAVAQVRAGFADIVLAVGADKMVVPDKKQTLGIFDGAWDVHDTEAGAERLLALGAGAMVPAEVGEMSERSFFMDVYASFARNHIAAHGTTQRQIAAVAAKNHNHSVHNSLAQYRKGMTIEEVLAAPSVIWPLTLPMCSPVSDGAAAAIVCSDATAKRLCEGRAAGILGLAVTTGVTRDAADSARHLAAIAAKRAYDEAAIDPADVDVAEVHDATAFAEIQQVENLGFCEIGAGGWLTESGATTLGGTIPVNPSGGLESKGHPIAATGLAQIFELVSQLRGEAGERQVEGARLAAAENGGGLYGIEEACAVVTVLKGARA